MAREVTDKYGTTWSCVEAYAGLDPEGKSEAASIEGTDNYRVIATPTGGAQTVEMELPAGWADDLSDDDLVQRIGQAA